jgi:hypothetical protein
MAPGAASASDKAASDIITAERERRGFKREDAHTGGKGVSWVTFPSHDGFDLDRCGMRGRRERRGKVRDLHKPVLLGPACTLRVSGTLMKIVGTHETEGPSPGLGSTFLSSHRIYASANQRQLYMKMQCVLVRS